MHRRGRRRGSSRAQLACGLRAGLMPTKAKGKVAKTGRPRARARGPAPTAHPVAPASRQDGDRPPARRHGLRPGAGAPRPARRHRPRAALRRHGRRAGSRVRGRAAAGGGIRVAGSAHDGDRRAGARRHGRRHPSAASTRTSTGPSPTNCSASSRPCPTTCRPPWSSVTTRPRSPSRWDCCRRGTRRASRLAERQGFPTCALGVYTFPGRSTGSTWRPGSATLVTLITPPYG